MTGMKRTTCSSPTPATVTTFSTADIPARELPSVFPCSPTSPLAAFTGGVSRLHNLNRIEVHMLDMPKNLLIVDDDSSILTALSQHFSELGYSVRSSKDGSSALSEIEMELPDILLSDLNMPGIPAIQFLLTVRRMFPSIRVVAMSGAYSGGDVPPAVAADAFYGKGSSLHLLTQAVNAMTRPGRSTIARSCALERCAAPCSFLYTPARKRSPPRRPLQGRARRMRW